MSGDPVNHPDHYNEHPVCEAIELCEELTFNLGNAVKYLWRAGKKGSDIEDMKKALWYLKREVERVDQARADAHDDELPPRDSTIHAVGIPSGVLKLARVIAAHDDTPMALQMVLHSLGDSHEPLSAAVETLEQELDFAKSPGTKEQPTGGPGT